MMLRPYPDYKNPGHPSIRMIPSHWNLLRNGRLFSQRNETGFGELPILEVSLRTGVRVRDMDSLKRKQLMSDREKYKRAAQGDLAYNMMRMWQGAVGLAPIDGLVSPAYIVLQPLPETECNYFSYLFRTEYYMRKIDAYSRGIVKDRNRLYWQDFKRMISIVPPIEEQKKICRFLHTQDSLISRFIRNKRKLIELLKEQKQAIINQAVTRGLDPDVKLKPSAVPWLGDIPTHWCSSKLKRIVHFTNGFAFKPADWKSAGVPIIRIQNLNGSTRYNYADPNNTAFHSAVTLPGSLLFAWSGNPGTSFGPFFWKSTEAGYLNQHIFKITNYYLDELYLYYALQAVTSHVEAQAHGVIGMVHVTKPELGSIAIPTPPPSEQKTIGTYLERSLSQLNELITKSNREIDLTIEYRTRLIADVVTGKIDVRNIPIDNTPFEEEFETILEEDDLLAPEAEIEEEAYADD